MYVPKRLKQKQRKHVEFSKVIIITAGLTNLAVISFACFMMYLTQDLSPLAYLIPSVAAEVATGTGFYYSKAKTENKIKLMQQYKVEPTEQSFGEETGYINDSEM